jgi:tRNA 2-thiouridine synthesizing protein A
MCLSHLRESQNDEANMLNIETHQTIDTCGTRCPIPLLRAKQALKKMQKDEVLKVLASDPSAKSDFDAMLKHLPHNLLDYQSVVDASGRVDTFWIRKG